MKNEQFTPEATTLGHPYKRYNHFAFEVQLHEGSTLEYAEKYKDFIDAAPDMYAALKNVYEKFGTMGKDWDDVKAALSKANHQSVNH